MVPEKITGSCATTRDMLRRRSVGIEIGDIDAVEQDRACLRPRRSAAATGTRWICRRRDGPTSATASPGVTSSEKPFSAAVSGREG